MFELFNGFVFVGAIALGTLTVFVAALIGRLFRKRKDNVESGLLRQYPELTEIIATERPKGAAMAFDGRRAHSPEVSEYTAR